MNRHHTLAWFAFSIASAVSIASTAAEFPTSEVPKSEPDYIAKAKTAAPATIVNKATIIMTQGTAVPKPCKRARTGSPAW